MTRKTLTLVVLGFAIALIAPASGSAVTIGSLAPVAMPASGCTNCNFSQIGTNPAAPSYETPFAGIITSYSMRASAVTASDKIALLLTYQKTSTGYLLKHLGEQLPFPATPPDGVATFTVHVPVESGWIIGMVGTTADTPMSYIPAPFQSGSVTGSFATLPTSDSTATVGGTADGHLLNLTANIEADADNDGFGDETEDCYPSDPARHGACPDVTAPVISGLKSKYAKFRVNTKGAVVAKSTPKGSRISLSLSEAASVNFTVSRAVKKHGKTTYKSVDSFARQLPVGASSFVFSGRYRDAKNRKRVLAPAGYRITATPVDAAGNVGAPARKSFNIVK